MHKILNKQGFTLAEVLITLSIVGVIAAMTMPTLINNIKFHTYDNAKRKILNSVGEAGRLLAIEGEITGAANAEDFVKNRLATKLSIAKMCDAEHLTDCGLPAKFFKTDSKTEVSMPAKLTEIAPDNLSTVGTDGTKSYSVLQGYGFVTANGYSVNLFYNGACEPEKNADYYYTQDNICFSAIYDMNGLRGPNVLGKDIGLLGLFYPNESARAVAVLPADYDYSSLGRGQKRTSETFYNAQKKCDSQFGKDYRMPDRDEIALIGLNGKAVGIVDNTYWSSSLAKSSLAWRHGIGYGNRSAQSVNQDWHVRCVRR